MHLMYSPTAAQPIAVYLQEQHPSILEHFEDFAQLLKGKRLAVFLDYDGEHQFVYTAWCVQVACSWPHVMWCV